MLKDWLDRLSIRTVTTAKPDETGMTGYVQTPPETVAVIAAAVSAYMACESPGKAYAITKTAPGLREAGGQWEAWCII